MNCGDNIQRDYDSVCSLRKGGPSFDEMFPAYDPGSRVIMQGILKKRGRWNPAWQLRFFVLEASGRLSYFLREDDKKIPERVRGIIPINVRAVVDYKQHESSGDSIGQITIHVPNDGIKPGRTFVLSARNQILTVQWIEALSSVQRHVQYISSINRHN